jgi:hypothetical protein
MGIPAGWKVRRVSRLTVLVGTFLVLVYFGLDEVHGDMASWLVIFGAVAVCLAWAKVWPEPKDGYGMTSNR